MPESKAGETEGNCITMIARIESYAAVPYNLETPLSADGQRPLAHGPTGPTRGGHIPQAMPLTHGHGLWP